MMNESNLEASREVRKPYLRERVFDALKDIWPLDKKIDEIAIKRAVDVVEKSKIRDYLKENGVYLDVGTALGHIVEEIVKQEDNKNIKFLACDPIWSPQERVMERVKEGGKIAFLKAEGSFLPIKDKSVDGASLFWVLHHVEPRENESIFNEINRVLKDDGYLFLTEDTPKDAEEAERVEHWDRRVNFEPKNEKHYYKSPEQWREFLQNNGWDIMEEVFFEDAYAKEFAKKEEGVIPHTSFIARKIKK